MADFCKRNILQSISFQFDWNTTYNGISKYIECIFKHFVEPLNDRFNKYGIYFYQYFYDNVLLDGDEDGNKNKNNIECQRLMIIPIGVDCGMADFCKKNNLRNMSLPFDWTVTYNGVSKCIEDNFKHFVEPLNDRFNDYGIYFHHDFYDNALFDEEKKKYNRRCQRLINILETSCEDIIFCRKGHGVHHHTEYCNVTSDIDDAENLNVILSNKYPQLKYQIIVFLVCDKCFNSTDIYKSNSDKIKIYNIATSKSQPEKDSIIENLCRDIFKV